ncbi:hypothetical protein ACFX13_016912 [Malus domestica]
MAVLKMLSKKASSDSHGQDSSYFQGWIEYEKNPYDQDKNPNGIIQMGLAENQLSFDLVESWLESNPHALELKRNEESVFRELALFQDYNGFPAFKNALVEFLAEMRGNKVKFDPNKIVLTAGSTPANETFMFCLADPGEAFLIPTPYYPGFDRDLNWRTGVEIVPIHCTSASGFRITESALEEAYQRTTVNRLELNHIIDFTIAKEIHIVSDEIYSGTAFNYPSFLSIAEALTERNLEEAEIWNGCHIVYSLSKDFGLPGFRVGMLYSNNLTVVSAATKMPSCGLISSQTQYMLSEMLKDKKFRTNYMEGNQKRLKERKEMLVCGLKGAGIRCLESNAGLFCWVDMRHLRSNTFEAEKELFFRVVCEFGLNISPGASCHCSEPGWFRACFANMSEETLTVAMQRVHSLVDSSTIVHKQLVMTKPRCLKNKWRLHTMVRD